MFKLLSVCSALALSPLAISQEIVAEQDFNALSSDGTFTNDDVTNGSPLTNASSFNQGGDGLDFETFWFDTRGITDGPVDGTESGDFIGVNSFSGNNSPDVGIDGTAVQSGVEQNFEFNDADGRLDLVFEEVDLSGLTGRVLSFDYWVADTGFEETDSFSVFLADDNASVEVFALTGTELDELVKGDNGEASEWYSVTVDLDDIISTNSLSESLVMTVSVDNDSGSENIFIDNVLFTSGNGDSDDDDDGGDDGSDDDAVTIGACFATDTAGFQYISAVQGASDETTMAGEEVVVEGVVTALRNNGFFMQEEQSDEDADSTSSEGIYVYYTGDLPSVDSVVRVHASAAEYFNMTQLSGVIEIAECASDTVPTLTTVSVSFPLGESESLEHYEGMLVSVSEMVAYDTATMWQYGQIGLSTSTKPTPTDKYAPLTAEYTQLVAENEENIILIEDNTSSSYPDELSFYTDFSYADAIRVGDLISATGPLNYSFGDYRINPVSEITLVGEREAAPDIDESNLSVATFNVLNYFNGDDDGNGGVTFDYDANRGAESEEEFALQEARIVAAITALDADIIGLMEIENDGFGADSAIQSLVDAINEQQADGNEYSFISTVDGELVGTDAIAVAIIYRASVVTPLDDAITIDMPAQLQADDSSYQQMRTSLLQSFTHTESEETLAIVVNHFKSKGSGCYEDEVDTTDIDSIQGSCNALRVSAAVTLGNALEELTLPENILVVGDLNAYSAEDPLAVLTSYDPTERGYTITTALRTDMDNGESVEVTDTFGYENVAESFDPDGFSYWYFGSAETGSLDHILASSELMDDIVDATHWNINSIEAYQLQYDQALTYYPDTDGYAFTDVGPYRSSDHDPFVVAIDFEVESTDDDTVVDDGEDDSDNDSSGGGSTGIWFASLLLATLFMRKRVR